MNKSQLNYRWNVGLRLTLLSLLMTVIAITSIGCGQPKFLVFGRPAPKAITPPTEDLGSVVFLDPWSMNPNDYEILGHIWFKGKNDFVDGGPTAEVARYALRSQAAQIGADAVVGFCTDNSAVWMGILSYPRRVPGIDIRWSSAIATRKLPPGETASRTNPPLWIAILPLLVTDEVKKMAPPEDLPAIKALLGASSQYIFGEKGYHADVIPSSLLDDSIRFDTALETIKKLADEVCFWSDYVLLLALRNQFGDELNDDMDKLDMLLGLYSTRDSRWVAAQHRGGSLELDAPVLQRILHGELHFESISPRFSKSGDRWNKTVVKLVKGVAEALPDLPAE